MKPLRKLDDFLNGITMYRLLLYGLGLLVGIGIFFCYMGILSYSGTGMLMATAILLPVCYYSNRLLAYIFKASPNAESALITGLILVCIMPPVTSIERAAALVAAGLIAMASKYVLAYNRKHIFNPAAIAAVIVGLLGLVYATWWIGTPNMLPFTLILGLLIIRKLRRFPLFLSFVVASLLMMLLVGSLQNQEVGTVIRNAFLSWPLIFMGTVMLTEPATTPPTQYYQVLYGALVGVLFASQTKLGPLHSTPEVALVGGNIFAYIVSPKSKLRLRLKAKTKLTPQVYDFAFESARDLDFRPGQYLEWTLPHHKPDGRGNRRSFSIASSPTEKDIHIGIKFYDRPSSFKQSLVAMKPGEYIITGQLAGDFILPSDQSKKLVFIAGGIGITPFRSMVKYVIDSRQKRDITIFYLINKPDDAAYEKLLESGKNFGVKVVYVMPGKKTSVVLDDALLKKEVPDYMQREFYISGPNAMVMHYKSLLRAAGVKRRDIKTDYFSGY